MDSFPSKRGGKLFAKVLLHALPGKPLKPLAYVDNGGNSRPLLRQELRCKTRKFPVCRRLYKRLAVFQLFGA